LKSRLREFENTGNPIKGKEELIERIIKIEKAKGNDISTQAALQISSFLPKLAEVFITEKMEGNLRSQQPKIESVRTLSTFSPVRSFSIKNEC